MEPIRIDGLASPDGPVPERRPAGESDDFEAILREVDADLGCLERLAEDARRAASDEGPVDPGSFRDAVRESEAALRSARRIRSRLLGGCRATQERSP